MSEKIFDSVVLLLRFYSNNGRLEVIERKTGISRRKLRNCAWQDKHLSPQDYNKIVEKFISPKGKDHE